MSDDELARHCLPDDWGALRNQGAPAPAAPGDADEALDLDKLMAALSLFDAEVNEHIDYITGAKARIAALEERHTALARALRRVEGADTLTAATVFAHCALDDDDWYARQLIKGKRGE